MSRFPKKIETIERITEDSEDFEKIITKVSNKYEEKAVNVAIAYQAAFNEKDSSKCDDLINFPHVKIFNQILVIR